MNNALEDFGTYLLSERGLSINTLEAYRRDIDTFLNFLKKHAVKDWSEVVQNHIYSYLALKKEQEYAAASVCRNFIAIKVFFRFLKREGLVLQNITDLLETPKVWQLIPDVLSQEEIGRILLQPDLETIQGLRDRAILEILYSCGIRVSELCNLKLYDVDDIAIRVQGKGGKERVVPIGSPAIKALDNYLDVRGDCKERDAPLFVSKRGKPLNRTAVWSLVKDYAKQARISKNISPHTFRHSFATHLLDNGADLRIIQELLGHSNISSTDRYTHISQRGLQDAFYSCHPRNI